MSLVAVFAVSVAVLVAVGRLRSNRRRRSGDGQPLGERRSSLKCMVVEGAVQYAVQVVLAAAVTAAWGFLTFVTDHTPPTSIAVGVLGFTAFALLLATRDRSVISATVVAALVVFAFVLVAPDRVVCDDTGTTAAAHGGAESRAGVDQIVPFAPGEMTKGGGAEEPDPEVDPDVVPAELEQVAARGADNGCSDGQRRAGDGAAG